MNIEIFILDDDKRNRMFNLALNTVLIWRRNKELQPQVIGERQKLIAPRRVDSVECFIEKNGRSFRHIDTVAAMIKKFGNSQDEQIVRNRLLAAGAHTFDFAVNDASFFVLRQNLKFKPKPSAVIENWRNFVYFSIKYFLAMVRKILSELILLISRIERISLSHKLDKMFVFRNWRYSELIAIDSKTAS